MAGVPDAPPSPDHKLLYISLGIISTGTDPLEKQLDPLGPFAPRGRSVRPSVKYVDYQKKFSDPLPHLTEFYGSVHEGGKLKLADAAAGSVYNQ